MLKEEAARLLDGAERSQEGSPELFAAMKEAGLVAAFGASDDLLEFRGAIYDEAGALDGTTAYLTSAGLVSNACDNHECPYHAREERRATPLKLIWHDKGNPCWTFETEIPHAIFTILDDEENDEAFCRGIVFALADIPAARGGT